MDLIYILIFFIGCFLLSLLERNFRIPFAKWIFILPFCLIIQSRSLFVPDTEIYMNYFLSEDSSLLNFNIYGFELAFQVLTKIIKKIVGEDFRMYFALMTLTNLLIIDYALKKIIKMFNNEQNESITENSPETLTTVQEKSYTILPLTLYVAFFGLYYNAIVLRVGIAFSLLILASAFAIKVKSKINYVYVILLLTLAYFFHSTALLGIIVILIILFSKQFSFRTYFIILLTIGIVYFSNLTSKLGSTVFNFITSLNNLTLLSAKLGNYGGESLFAAEGISMKFVFFWLMSFVLAFYGAHGKIYYKFLNVYIFGLAIFALMRRVLLVERVTDYFLIFSFVLFCLFLILQDNFKFWMYYVGLILIQAIFVLRITNQSIV